MKRQEFDKLVASVRQAGRIRRGRTVRRGRCYTSPRAVPTSWRPR